ncbi:MAG: ELM1/GtrOC1 family putative glycosyltransferase [Candidatus Omnitrophota bacterium]
MNFLVDYLGYILLRAITVFFVHIPAQLALYIGRVIGVVGYHLDRHHRNIAYHNLKMAFGQEKPPAELKRITRRLYQNFSQNIVELLRLPAVDAAYLKRYISIEGEEYLKGAIGQKKGFIFLAVHFGSWEVSNVLGAMFGYTYKVIAKEQKRFKRLSALLTSYRQITGANVVNKGWGTRDIIEGLQNNEVVGMVADQGGKSGVFINFFGRPASMSAGAIRIALKLGVTVLPVFLIRIKGPHHLLKVMPPLDLNAAADFEEKVRINLAKAIGYAEEVVRQYPDQYAWFYKVWKYSRQREILILSDGKAGHLRQSEAVAGVLEEQLKRKGLVPATRTIEIRFKSRFACRAAMASSFFSNRGLCQGCQKCLKYFLAEKTHQELSGANADFIISCGSALAGINLIVAAENQAKSIAVLKPVILGVKRFSLVIMPKHDLPPAEKNVFITLGAVNGFAAGPKQFPQWDSGRSKIGILIGGDTKNSRLDKGTLASALDLIKAQAEARDLDILVTTSRRTPRQIEELIKEKLSDFARCKLLVVANEKNIPDAVAGILSLSHILVVTDDSISMVSEAASSGQSVLVLREKSANLTYSRRDRFLRELSEKNHILLSDLTGLSQNLEALFSGRLKTKLLNDREVLVKAVNSII